MSKSMVKNILIVVLSSLCFYQTLRLWFWDLNSSNRGLFSFFAENDGGSAGAESLKSLAAPFRIIVPDAEGSGRFFIHYSTLGDRAVFVNGTEAAGRLLKNGEFIGAAELDMAELLSRGPVVFEYRFPVPPEAYASSLEQRPGLLSSRLESFNMVFFIPDETGDFLSIFFIDSLSGQKTAYEFRLQDKALCAAFLETAEQSGGLYYVFSGDEGYGFGSAIFLAKSDSGGFEHKSAVSQNAYHEGSGTMSLRTVENGVDVFFDDPAVKLKDGAPDVYTFSDENTVVKYYRSGLLEYSSWKSNTGSVTGTFASAYAAAVDFINKDGLVVNGYYLADYSNDGKLWHFYFDLTVGDMPVFLADSLKESLGLSSAIEVTVQDDKVSKYRKYACSFVANLSESTVINYALAIENIAAIYGVFEADFAQINRFDLGFKADGSRLLSLAWHVGFEDLTFTMPAQ